MSTRKILLSAFLAAGLMAGCGPTRAGLEARAKARERLNVVNAELSRDQAVQALEAGQFDKATKEIGHALALVPTWPEYHVIEGRIFLEQSLLEKALQCFRKALELKPDYPRAHYYCGVVYQRWSDDAQAYEHYREAFEQEPDQVANLLAAAESLVALDKLDEAKDLLNSKLSYFENNAAIRHLLGQIALLQDDPATAAALYTQAWRLRPDDDTLLEELARAQYDAKMFGDSYRSVLQLIDRPGGDRPEIKLLEARCLTELDRLTDARNLYVELTKLNPTDTELWVELGTVAWEIGDYHRMALCGARATALAPDRFEGYLLKGINERHHGNLKEAIVFLRQAADRAANTPMPHLLLGKVLEENGEREKALEAYGTALQIDPDNESAKALWGEGRVLLATPPMGEASSD